MDAGDAFHVGVVTPVIHYCMGGLKMNPDAEILTPATRSSRVSTQRVRPWEVSTETIVWVGILCWIAWSSAGSRAEALSVISTPRTSSTLKVRRRETQRRQSCEIQSASSRVSV